MHKQVITKDDGRYLIFYTFPVPETPGDEDEEAECSPSPRRRETWTPHHAGANGDENDETPTALPLCLGEDPEA